MNASKFKQAIKNKASELGFFYCGFSKVSFLEEEAPHLEKWLKNNYQGSMAYMANHFDKRLNPKLLVDDANTVISLLLNYHTETLQKDPLAPKLSKYAYGEDYHFVIKDKLGELLSFMKQEIGAIEGRVFVDSAPVMDKVWAKKAGLGWMGKNTNLIHPKEGSFFFIAEIITDVVIEEDGPMKDYCGTCTKCIDACPTDAIVAPYVVDGSKCISHLTIELKDAILPEQFKGKMDNWMFGCDVCQDVCPWNKFGKINQEKRFQPSAQLLDLNQNDWEDLEQETFQSLFKNSAVKRTKFEGLKRNISFLKK